MTIITYAVFIVNLANLTQGFRCTNDGNGLDGDSITETGALAIDDTWNVDVCAHAVLLASFDDSVVGAHGLRGERPVSSRR